MARLARHRFALYLGNQGGEVTQGVCRPFHIGAHPGNRIAAVHSIHQCQLIGVFVDSVSKTNQIFRALRDRQCRPCWKRRLGAGNSLVNIGLVGERHIAQWVAVGWVDRGNGLARTGLDPLATNEQSLRRKIEIRRIC